MKHLSSDNWQRRVLWCRAAAYGKMGEHQKSINDCKKALELDPKYGKAYGRMGCVASVVQDTFDDDIFTFKIQDGIILLLQSIVFPDTFAS